MLRFDRFHAEKKQSPKVTAVSLPKPAANGHAAAVKQEGVATVQQPPSPPSKAHHDREDKDEEGLSDVVDTPPKKKRKAEPLDEDALFAARLQAEENSRAKTTRGGTNRKCAIVKKKRSPVKKKTAKKIKSEDDSGLEGSGSDVEDKEVNRSGGFHVSKSPELDVSWLTPSAETDGAVRSPICPPGRRDHSKAHVKAGGISTDCHSCPALRPSRGYGHTSERKTSKTLTINDKSDATRQ